MRMGDADCLYGDGTVASDWPYQACWNASAGVAGVATCCLPNAGERCLANGLCAGKYPYRGPCDGSRGLPCPRICPGVRPDSWTEVQPCSRGTWCCAPLRNNTYHVSGDCCADGSPRFALADLVSTTISASAPTSTSSSSTPSSSSSSSSPSSSSSLSAGTIAGATVGSLAGAALLICGVAWVLRRRRNPFSHGEPALYSKQSRRAPTRTTTTTAPSPSLVEADVNTRFEIGG